MDNLDLTPPGVDTLYKIFVLATALVIFAVLENVWRNNKRWIPLIIIFPPSIFLFIISYWAETRGICFFAALTFAVMLLVGGLVGYSFFEQIIHMLAVVAFWPYYLYAAVRRLLLL